MVQRLGIMGDFVYYPKVDGEYVKYEDYAALEKERDALLKLHRLAYEELTSDESMHWVNQAINHLEGWLDD